MHKKLERGLIQVYTGNGKGKSTAAFGQALRAAGSGFNVKIIQFMKGGVDCPEAITLKNTFPYNMEIVSFGTKGFISQGNGKESDHLLAGEAYCLAVSIVEDDTTDVLILDEINNAVFFGLIDIELVVNLLRLKPPQMEIILTGRNAPAEIIELADLVTSMEEIKHPYRQGIAARQGIEF